MEKNTQEFTIEELAQRAGVARRTIRYYIARGLLPGPMKAGRGAGYKQEHLRRLEEIRNLQANGLTLVEIAHRLQEPEQSPSYLEPTVWRHYQLAADVIVMLREDVAPWKVKAIRRALGDLINHLNGNINQPSE